MTSLRTIWGTELKKVNQFGKKFGQHFLINIHPFLEEESVIEKNEIYNLTTKGKLLNHISHRGKKDRYPSFEYLRVCFGPYFCTTT